MKSVDQSFTSLHDLHTLADYARFLLNEKLDAYCQLQLQYSYELEIPLLKYLETVPKEEQHQLARKGTADYLGCLADHQAARFIEDANFRWKTNHLPFLDKNSVVAEDITRINYLRKKLFLDFIPDYTKDPATILSLVGEIDFFMAEVMTASTNTFVEILQNRIEEHLHFIRKVAETVPGAVYVFDLEQYKGIYANHNLTNIIGYSQEDLNRMGENAIHQLLHPDDVEVLRQHMDVLRSAKDNTVHVCRYRVREKNGSYKWLASYEAVFKRNEDGAVRQTISITLDVSHEQAMTAENQRLIKTLSRSEALYKKAEEIANMGNWVWYVKKNKLEWTDQLYRIYGLEPQVEEITIERFLSFIHPHDLDYVKKGVDELSRENNLDYLFRIITPDGKEKWLRSLAHVIKDKEGNVSTIIGIEQDVTEREKLIERLKQSEWLYKQAQTLSHIGNWSFDLQTKEILWSDELYNIYERENGSPITEEEWKSYIDPEDRQWIETQLQQTINGHRPLDVVHRILLPNGKLKVLHRRGEVVYNEAAQPVKLVGTTQDITEHSQIQSELKESQMFIRKITDATPSIIATYNVNTGRYSFISEGLGKLLGYSTEDVLKNGVAFFVERVHPEDLPSLTAKNTAALEKANADGEKQDLVAEFTYRIKHKNGTWRWLHTYGTVFDYNSKGQVEHILNISLDVTEQMEASKKIEEQEHFIQQIADASPTILYLFDVPSQRIAYINREAFFVLGYLPDEILEEGAGITEFLYHPEDIPLLPCRKQSQKTFQQVDSMIQYECRMRHKEGDFRWLLVREIVFKTDEEGKISQIIGAALDINRRKEMERTILQNTLQLEQSNASLEEFAYVASHDLKEPLRKISTFGDRLVASQIERLSDDGKVYLRKIVDASQRMQNMISDLLSISMISGNHAFETYSLQKVLEETIQTLEFKIESKQAIIRYDTLPEANIIPLQFRQLFQNLLSNSLKFAREDVQPVITITCTDADAYEVAPYQLKKAEHYRKLTFSDNGIGFENEYAQKIFAIFQRLHGRSEYEGSGIGLAICKKIVEHHGGVIFAQGEPDKGARFTIILPS